MGEPPTVVRELSLAWHPHADTYRRVFERVNPEALTVFSGLGEPGRSHRAQVIPIDGKSVKGSYGSKKAVSLTSGECLGKFASTLAWGEG